MVNEVADSDFHGGCESWLMSLLKVVDAVVDRGFHAVVNNGDMVGSGWTT